MSGTVLIVEDSAVDRSLLTGLLEERYEVLQAGSVAEMLDVLRGRAKFLSAILLDIGLPEIDGFQALRILRGNAVYRQIPVVVATVQTDAETQARALSLGAAGFAEKPYHRAILLPLLDNLIRLRETSALSNTFHMDALTGLMNRARFFERAQARLAQSEAGGYMMACVDVENFKVLNDQYGASAGDEVLRHIAKAIRETMEALGGLCCRDAADKFGMLYPARFAASEEVRALHRQMMASAVTGHSVKIRVGRYRVDDSSLPVSAMYDRASLAEESIKGRYDTYIAYYTDAMRTRLLDEQRVVNDMDRALAAGEFEPWFQPQYNHATGALIGAEALVRWRKNGTIVPPDEFILVFERNGFIYEVDQYIWRQVCILLRRWLDEGKEPLPVSVNISRYDLFQKDFLDVITGLVGEYALPVDMLRLEITESAFSESSNTIIHVVNQLIELGFTVEIDDFGSGYSSLNTLKDVPAAILKLDMKFFENTENSQRGGNIVESVVRMAKWLGMAVIAEGVEEREQADYLLTIGCYYIQGFFYSRPIPAGAYERALSERKKERRLSRLQTLQTLDNNEFWNPRSLDTLIFNSYVGAACILEYDKGRVEMIRATDHYVRMLGSTDMDIKDVLALDWAGHMDAHNLELFSGAVAKSLQTRESVMGEYAFRDLPGCPRTTYLRVAVRVIAAVGERCMVYCLSDNITAQRAAEREALIASERVNAVMDHSHCGITAVVIHENRVSDYLFINHRFYELLGYTKAQFEAEVADPFARILPEDHDRVMEAALQMTEIGSTAVIKLRALRRDGTVIWLRGDISTVRFANEADPVQLSSFLDITEAVRNEAKQLESARQLEVIMNNISGGVSAIQIHDDGTSHFVFNNERYYGLYGYTGAQARAARLDVMSCILPEDFDGVMRKVSKLKADRQPVLIDYRIRKRDGSLAMLRANASLMKIPGYEEDVITSVITDITEKKSLEDQLRAIVDNIYGGVSATVLRDGEPEFVIVNNRFFEILGYETRAEFEAACGCDKYAQIHPEDKARIIAQFESADGGKQRYSMEYRVIRKDGAIRHILNNISVVHLFGVAGPVQLSVVNDITAMVEAQQAQLAVKDRLQTVMNVMPGGLTAVAFRDGGMEFLFANDRYYELHGIRRGSIGEDHLSDVLNFVVPEDRDRMRHTVRQAVQTGRSATEEYQIRRPDGALRWMRAVINMTKLVGIDAPVQVAVFSDITDIKEANQQLRFLNSAARDILAQPDDDRAIADTLGGLLAYFAADRGYVVEFDEEKRVSDNTYEVCAEGVASAQKNLQGIPFAPTDAWYDTLRSHRFLAIHDVDAMEDSQAELRQMLRAQGIRAIVLAPLWRDARLLGFVGVDNPRRAAEQIAQLTSIADYITFALTRRDMRRKIEHDMEAVQTLMDDMPGGFARMAIHPGAAPAIVSLNEGMCRMLGMTRAEVLAAYGGDAHRLFTPEEIEETAQKVAEALRCCGQYSCRCTLHCKEGRQLRVMAFGRFVRDETGRVFLNAYFTDLSAQSSLEEKQKLLLDNLPTGAAMYAYDGTDVTVIHINRQYWRLVGRAPVDYGKASVLGAIHPDDQRPVLQEIAAAIRQERVATVDARILCGEQCFRPFNLRANITPDGTGGYLLYVSYAPISDDAMSLQEMLPIALSTMMAASDDISYVKDKDLRYICCSNTLAAVVGAQSTRDLIGKSAFELFEAQYAEKFTEDDQRVLETGEPVMGAIERIPFADGSIRLGRTSKFPLMDAAGNAVGVYCVYHDVTTQKQNESQLKLLTDSIPGGIATFRCTEDEYRMSYCNDGFCALFGYTKAEFHLSMSEIMERIFAQDRANIEAQIARLVKDGTPLNCVYRIHTRNGGYRWLSHNAVLADRMTDAAIINAVFLDITEQQEEKERLRVSEEEYRLATRHSGNTIGRYNIAERTLTISEDAANHLALPECIPDVPYGRVNMGKISEATAADYIAFYEKIMHGEAECSVTFQKLLSIGWRWITEQATTIFDDDGKPVSAIISYTDVTEQQEKEAIYTKWQQTLQQKGPESYTIYQTNLNKDGLFDTKEGELLDFYPEFIGNLSFNERVELFIRQVVFEEDQAMYRAFLNSDTMLASYYRGKRVAAIDFRAKMPGGALRWLRLSVELVEYPSSKDVQAYMLYEDIDAAKRAELDTLERAETDPLTGILNRAAFIARMEQILQSSAPDDKHALLMLDVDNFKQVNDTLGHAAGDQVLIDLTASIRAMLRHDDLLGRLGGDEFFVLLKHIRDDEMAETKAKQICGLQITTQDAEKRITASVGIALIPKDGRDFDTLYKKVDAALYRQKAQGKNGYRFVAD